METLLAELTPLVRWIGLSTAKASVVIGLVLLLRLCFHRHLASRWWYVLWIVVMIRLLCPWMPQSRFSLFNVRASVNSLHGISSRSTVFEEGGESVAIGVEGRPLDASVPSDESLPVVSATTASPSLSRWEMVSLFWLGGAVLVAVFALASDFRLWLLVRKLRNVTDGEVLELFEDCKTEMGVHTTVGLVLTEQVTAPCLFGVLRPRLLLPVGTLETLSEEQLRHVFLHEFAHLRRFDNLWGWLMLLVQALHWFNPLIWLSLYRMRTDREIACDSLVLAALDKGEQEQYGTTIVDLSTGLARLHFIPSMTGIVENSSFLKRRVTMIALYETKLKRHSFAAALFLILFALFTLTDAQPTIRSGSRVVDSMPDQLHQDLLLYYSFDRNGGTKAVDASGMDFHGKIVNAQYLPDGRFGGAMAFNGRDSQIVLEEMQFHTFTFSAWVKREMDIIGNRVLMQLYNGDRSYSIQAGFSVCIGPDREIGDGLEGRGIFTKGRWTHVIVTFDGHQAIIYRDGERFSQGIAPMDSAIIGPLYIGGTDVWRRENAGFWQGALDEVALFNRALLEAEVHQLYALSLGDASSVLSEYDDKNSWSMIRRDGGTTWQDAKAIASETWFVGGFDERDDERWYELDVSADVIYSFYMDDEFGSGKYTADPIMELSAQKVGGRIPVMLENRNDFYHSPLKYRPKASGTIYIRLISDNPGRTSFALGFTEAPSESAAVGKSNIRRTRSQGQLDLREFIIEALVDDTSELWIYPDKIQWHNFRDAKPGRQGGRNEATYIHGNAWTPTWQKQDEDAGPDQSGFYAFSCGTIELDAELLAVGEERGGEKKDRDSSIRAYRRNDAFVIRFEDVWGGPAWFKVLLSKRSDSARDVFETEANRRSNSGAVNVSVLNLKVVPDKQEGLFVAGANIQNTSDEPVDRFSIYFYINDPLRKNPRTHEGGPLRPKGTWHEMAPHLELKEGSNQVEVVIDVDDRIPETNEYDNLKAIQVVVQNGKVKALTMKP